MHSVPFILLCLFIRAMPAIAQTLLAKSDAYYATPEAYRVAETVLLYQHCDGGWPKNYDPFAQLDRAACQRIESQKTNIVDSTIDNGATTTELRFLDRIAAHRSTPAIQTALRQGLSFLLQAQYANGGFPQYPNRKSGYWIQITFNDTAMIHTLRLLQAVAEKRLLREVADDAARAACKSAIDRGIACILACQIRQGDTRLLWCAQHDRETLKPVGARSYERASLSGSESVEIVRFLMEQPQPTPEMQTAIHAAIDAFRKLALHETRVVRRRDPQSGTVDLVVERDPQAPLLWARFYDLETHEPFFCSRDGVPRKQLAEISYERRNHYSWLGPYAQRFLEKEYPDWLKSHPR